MIVGRAWSFAQLSAKYLNWTKCKIKCGMKSL
jgi:hypothetical protein